MDFFQQKLQSFTSYFGKREVVKEEHIELTALDSYLEFVYKVLSWDDPTLTWVVFIVLNVIFWLAVQLELRFFGFIFLTILGAFLYETYFENTTERNYVETIHTQSVKELRNNFMNIFHTLKALRKDSPSSFCIAMCTVFLTLSFVAKNVSGYVLFYLLMVKLFFFPLLLSKLPPQYLESVKRSFKAVTSEHAVLAEDELIPFIAGKDFSSKDPELDSLLTDRTADSATNSLISGITTMPSYLDVEELQKDIEEEDLLPLSRTGVSFTGELSSDSDSEHHGIKFDSSHFNDGDSSSEEENNYCKGLKFTDSVDSSPRAPLEPAQTITGIISNVASSVGSHLVANIMQSATTNINKPIRKDSSSDSEFEIINSGDLDEQT